MQNNPGQTAPEIILPMERLDQVLFNMDTLHLKDRLLERNTRYPFISEVLLQQMLAIDSDQVEQYRSGKDKVFAFFVGQVMKAMQGKANPAEVNKMLIAKLTP